MAFVPIERVSLGTALLGTGEPVRFRAAEENIFERGIPGREDIYARTHGKSKKSYSKTILLVVISAVIFVTAVAIYDVFRSWITNYFARKTLEDPREKNASDDIRKTEIANHNTYLSNVTFAVFTLLIAAIAIPTAIYLIQKFE